MSAPIVYGIANCDTVKKARRWLEQHDIQHQYHDFRRDGLTKSQLQSWLTDTDVDVILNKRSRTWRELDEQSKANVTKAKAITLMLEQPSLIKRPLVCVGKQLIVGFDVKRYESVFKS